MYCTIMLATQIEERLCVGIGKTRCFLIGLNTDWLQESLLIANIAELSLRPCQYRRAFIALLPTENNNIPGLKYPLRNKQITNVCIAPLPAAVCNE